MGKWDIFESTRKRYEYSEVESKKQQDWDKIMNGGEIEEAETPKKRREPLDAAERKRAADMKIDEHSEQSFDAIMNGREAEPVESGGAPVRFERMMAFFRGAGWTLWGAAALLTVYVYGLLADTVILYMGQTNVSGGKQLIAAASISAIIIQGAVFALLKNKARNTRTARACTLGYMLNASVQLSLGLIVLSMIAAAGGTAISPYWALSGAGCGLASIIWYRSKRV